MKAAYLIVLALLLAVPFVMAQEEQQTQTSDQANSQTQQQTETQSSGSSSSSSGSESGTTDTSSSQTSGGAGGADQQTTTQTSSSSGGGTAENIAQPMPVSQPPVMQPACAQVTTLAVDGAGNCQQFSNACLPPGWNPVDKCPERKPVISPDQMPQGCKELKDENGFVKVICDSKPMECPRYSDEEVKKCESSNGKPNFFMDQRGCKIFECRFQQESGQFMQQVKCPPEEERQRISEKCKSNNMDPVIRRDYNGCKFVECVSPPKESCPTSEDWERISKDCAKKGGMTVTDHNNGCNIPKCELRGRDAGEMRQGGACINVQKENFDRCREEGGEMIVKEDKGKECITYAKCVKRGNERDVQYEEVDEMPQSSMLLSLAFKLEQMKIDFNKLAKQTDDIANYYAASGDKESEERFRKVSSMFIGANQKIDDIKNKMRERISSLTKEDISDFKHDVKYIKEVVIQDILYVMLSTEAGETGRVGSIEKMPAKEGCGADGWCFNKALRTCEKTKFYPEEKDRTEITIDGLEGKNCIIKASVTTPAGEKSMVCKYPNYVMGMESPDDLLPYCEGSMVDDVKKYPRESGNREIRREPARNRPIERGGEEFEPRDREEFPMEEKAIEPERAIRQEMAKPIERAPIEGGFEEFP